MKRLLQLIFLAGLITSWSATQAQSEQIIKGSVTDVESNETLPGVSVAIKGTAQGVVTDIDGKFSLTVKTLPVTLVFSAAGFRTQEVEVADASEELPIQLTSGSQLAAVTVTARRRTETAQEIPIPISVVGGVKMEEAGAFNVTRVKGVCSVTADVFIQSAQHGGKYSGLRFTIWFDQRWPRSRRGYLCGWCLLRTTSFCYT